MRNDFVDKSQAEKYLLLTGGALFYRPKVISLWDSYSGLPGLLNASSSSEKSASKYFYSEENNAYYLRGSNRRITDRQIRNAVNKVSNHSKDVMRKETQQLIAGIILASVWYLRMETLMATLYKTLWTLSIGGLLFDNDILRNEFYLFSLMQFKWLDNFYDQIKNRSQPLDGTAMNRAGLYGTYGYGFYQNAILRKLIDTFDEAKRVLGPNEDHCNRSHERLGCIDLAEKGWMPIERMVPIGDAACYSNCHCHIIYR